MSITEPDVQPSVGATIPLAEEHEIWILLNQLTEGMLKARDSELRPFGVSSIQLGVMYAVNTSGGAPTASDISRILLRRPASIYELLGRMENQGLVKCSRTTEGKKEVRVALTEKGDSIYRQHTRQVIPRILGELSQDEREQFKSILRRLRTRTYAELAEQPAYP
ncbi:MAG: winged helix DNA-binding protein [Chloroflexi bacterium]|nr:winged helix DNA-binding protein [Chloroflexota bacterium]